MCTAAQVGKPRPNFIDKCDPIPRAYEMGQPRPGSTDSYALPFSSFCTNSDLTDELKSFPSGHASAVAVLTMFGMFYFLYSYYNREIKAAERYETGWLARAWGDLTDGLVGGFVFLQFLWVRPATHGN